MEIDMENKLSKASIGMKALLAGFELKLGESTYRLFQPGEEVQLPSMLGVCDSYWLGIKMHSSTRGEVWLGTDIGFPEILNHLDRVPEEDVIGWVGRLGQMRTRPPR